MTAAPGSVTNQYRTARRFKNPSPLFRWAEQSGLLQAPGAALVFGAGLLGEAVWLSSRGWKVDALETIDSIKRRESIYVPFANQGHCRIIGNLAMARKRYNLITVTHVLEFIENPEQRVCLLRQLTQRLTNKGILLLSLRGWSDVLAAKHQAAQGDGIVTGLGTWVRGFSIPEGLDLAKLGGLRVVRTPHGRRASSPEQVRFVCQRL